jgi:hypothetical protein
VVWEGGTVRFLPIPISHQESTTVHSLRATFAATIVFSAQVALAGEMQFIQINTKHCGLFESGTKHAKKLYPGFIEAGLCFVRIPVSQFRKTYEFCALSTVLPGKEPAMCEFDYYTSRKEEVSFMAKPGSVCIFMCMTK